METRPTLQQPVLPMSDRFGFDAPKSQPIEDSIVWAAGNGFRYIDFQAEPLLGGAISSR